MSQKKVDAYKAQKANRAKIAKKEKMQYMIETGIGAVIACVVVVWMGFSVYDKATSKPADENTVVTETVIDTTALDEYIADLNAVDAE